jgi:thioesterase domain-containing protein
VNKPVSMRQDAPYGPEYLQHLIDREFPLARHIGIAVESAHDGGVVLCAPFAPNANHKGTAFGGSLFCVAVLAGWAWVTRYLAARELCADAVVQESTIHYLLPVQGELRSILAAPSEEHIAKFLRMLRRGGRGRIRLHADILEGRALAARFDGVFAAIPR